MSMWYKGSMQPLIHSNSAQKAKNWSAQLGDLAAERSTTPTTIPTWLLDILHRIQQPNQVQRDSERDLRTHEFLAGA